MTRLLFFFLIGCASSDDSGDVVDTGDDDGACGDPVTYDVEIHAKVVEAAGGAAEGIEVTLEDRGWTMADLGTGTTDARGEVTFTAVGVTSLANCWGTVLNYHLVAVDPADDTRSADDTLNTQLHAAIDEGTFVVDVREFPLTLP